LTHLFTGANQEVLEMFAWSNVLLAFDYDGTLAPLVSARARARMRVATRRLLRRAGALYPCVVISGRAQADVLGRLRGITICRVIGNHGTEPSSEGAAARRRVRQWMPVLEARLSGRQGVDIENKRFSVAVHYRQAKDRRAARDLIMTTGRLLEEVRVVGGKLVVNFLVAGAPQKGLALERERTRFGCDAVIYVGDDETDEDVFRLARPAQLLSIRIGRKQTSAARYYIRDQSEIDRLLGTLVAIREGHVRRSVLLRPFISDFSVRP
jgi:trehalose 6-phosphate phosphatase